MSQQLFNMNALTRKQIDEINSVASLRLRDEIARDHMSTVTMYRNFDPYDNTAEAASEPTVAMSRGGIYALNGEKRAEIGRALRTIEDLAGGQSIYKIASVDGTLADLVARVAALADTFKESRDGTIVIGGASGHTHAFPFGNDYSNIQIVETVVTEDDVSTPSAFLLINSSDPAITSELVALLDEDDESLHSFVTSHFPYACGRNERVRDQIALHLAKAFGFTLRLAAADVAEPLTVLRTNILEYNNARNTNDASQAILFYYGVLSLTSARFQYGSASDRVVYYPQTYAKVGYVVTHMAPLAAALVASSDDDAPPHFAGVPTHARRSVVNELLQRPATFAEYTAKRSGDASSLPIYHLGTSDLNEANQDFATYENTSFSTQRVVASHQLLPKQMAHNHEQLILRAETRLLIEGTALGKNTGCVGLLARSIALRKTHISFDFYSPMFEHLYQCYFTWRTETRADSPPTLGEAFSETSDNVVSVRLDYAVAMFNHTHATSLVVPASLQATIEATTKKCAKKTKKPKKSVVATPPPADISNDTEGDAYF